MKAVTNQPPRIAILLSTFNGVDYLAAQLDSLRAQCGVATQVYVRDDGSTDGTWALLEAYTASWSNLHLLSAGPNLGPCASFLALLKSAPDDFDGYAFCDQDDVWLEDKLHRAAESLRQLPPERPAAYCSQVLCVDDELRTLGEPRPQADTRFEHLLFENIAYGCTMVLNGAARAVVNASFQEQGIAMHDWWCALVTAALGRLVYDPRPSVLYRQHSANTVGASTGRARELLKHARSFRRNARTFYPIHAQASALQRHYGDRLSDEEKRMVAALVDSNRSFRRRAKYALSARVVRTRRLDAIVARGLVLVGWY